MNTKQKEEIIRHGEKLKKIFPTQKDPLTLCKMLRRLELKATDYTTAYCNGGIDGPDILDTYLEKILNKLNDILHFRSVDVPVFINRDPRGYALKIRENYVNKHRLDIHRDFGGYGIIAPEIN